MAIDYAETAQSAHDAIVDAGGGDPGVTLTRTTRGGHDAASGAPGAGTTTTTAGVGLVFDYELINSGAGTYDSSLTREGDKRLILSTMTLAGVAIAQPKKGADRVLCPDGSTYNVERVKVISPTGVPVLYDVQLRL